MRPRTALLLLALSLPITLTPAAPAQTPAPAALPVTGVTLYTSGVGYFERGGSVDGEASQTLLFPVGEVNDVLKSLVLLDGGGGTIRPVTYGALDPLGKQLSAFSVDVSDNPDPATLLNRMRGAEVTVTYGDTTGPKTVTGTVVGTQTQTVTLPNGGGTTQQASLTLLSGGGLKTIPLASVTDTQINDPALRGELASALAAVAQSRDASKRPVTLNFSGRGRRSVRVGYLTEAPLWQSSYRLVLGKQPVLQGWASVQNTGQDDWTGVRLTLVSGRPISFIQDLYTPLYLPRPVVQASVSGSPTPQAYGGNLDRDEGIVGGTEGIGGVQGTVRDANGQPIQGAQVVLTPTGGGDAQQARADASGYYSFAGVPVGLYNLQVNCVTFVSASQNIRITQDHSRAIDVTLSKHVVTGIRSAFTERMDTQSDYQITATDEKREKSQPNGLYQSTGLLNYKAGVTDGSSLSQSILNAGVKSSGAQLGTALFTYRIASPVSIPRQKSALIPFLAGPVQAESVSIFNPDVQADHPLLGARLKNTTGLHLMGGPLTVFDEGAGGETAYVGDALVQDTEPGQTRLLSYAVDLALDASEENGKGNGTVSAVKLYQGNLVIKTHREQSRIYTVKNNSDKARLVVVEHPYHGADWTLLEPKTAGERTADTYRFDLPVGARESRKLTVREAYPDTTTYGLLGTDPDALLFYVKSGDTSPAVTAALQDILARRTRVAGLQAKIAALDAETQAITQGQERIRGNMRELDRTSPLYVRYVGELDAQETKLETLKEQRAARQTELDQAQNALNDLVANVNLG